MPMDWIHNFSPNRPRTIIFTSGNDTEAKQLVIGLINSMGLVRNYELISAALYASVCGRQGKGQDYGSGVCCGGVSVREGQSVLVSGFSGTSAVSGMERRRRIVTHIA